MAQYRTVCREMRDLAKRLSAAASELHKLRELARPIGSYTESRFDRAASCLMEAADCMSYALGNVETYMDPSERDPAMAAVLSALATPRG